MRVSESDELAPFENGQGAERIVSIRNNFRI